jgi:DNA-binding transcriptional ArsR family regulator
MIYNQMVIYSPASLDSVFSALADPARRHIVERLSHGGLPIGAAADGLSISQPAVSKHVKILEQSGLIRRRVAGRVHHIELCPGAMTAASSWMETQRAFWESTFDRLNDYFAHTQGEA